MARLDELRPRLTDDDAEVRALAAMSVADLVGEGEPLPACLAAIADADLRFPGVADAFYATAAYDLRGPTVAPWVLQVLQRRAGRPLVTPVPGNDLEFHAHELFDADAGALRSLLAWGYRSTVEMALDHGALPRGEMIALTEALWGRGARFAEWLALRYGEVIPELPSKTIHQEWGARRQWRVWWIFDAAGDVLAGLPLGEPRADLVPSEIEHITLPEGLSWTFSRPRRDLQLALAHERPIARVVQARSRL